MKTNETRPVSVPPQGTRVNDKSATAKRAFAEALEETKPQLVVPLAPMTSLPRPSMRRRRPQAPYRHSRWTNWRARSGLRSG